MSASQLDESLYELRYAAARHNWVLKRTLKTMWKTRSVSTACFVHDMNRKFVSLARAITQPNSAYHSFDLTINQRTEKLKRAMAL
jgi:hypothetical protein